MDGPNIILVVMDSVTSKRMSTYGYERQTTPHIDRLAEESMLFKEVFANSSWTVPSHGSLFTGKYPSEHGAHANHKFLSVSRTQTLAGALSEVGYRTMGISANPWISSEFGFDTGFDQFLNVKQPVPFENNKHPREFAVDSNAGVVEKYVSFARWLMEGNPVKRGINMIHFRQNSGGFADAIVLNDRIGEWIENTSTDQFFIFVNYMDAHEPYNPSFNRLERFRESKCSVDITWHLPSLDDSYDAQEIACIRDLYDASLHFLDEQIDSLISLLKRQGVFDDTMLVLTSDHGKCLGEHEYMGVGTYLHDELVHIPLVVSMAAGQSISTKEPIDHVRIHDIIREMAGLERSPDKLEGTFSETRGPHQDVNLKHSLPAKGQRRVDSDGATLIRDNETGDLVRLSSDTDGSLSSLEAQYLDSLEVTDTKAEVEMSDDVKNHLKELGYIF